MARAHGLNGLGESDLGVGSQVASYLDQNRSDLIQNWMQKVIVESGEEYQNSVGVNGVLTLELLIECVNSLSVNEDKIRRIAYKVSLERMRANANIGDFVYNVSVGRSEVYNLISNMNVPMQELQPALKCINEMFDKFLHFAVRHYNDLTSRQLEEQSDFIERSHKDKMTILGQMSSSFVHEFRNPLTSVIGFMKLLRDKYPSLEYMDVVAKELDELSFRITQFLLVSKKETDYNSKMEFCLADIVDGTLDFLYPMIVNDNIDIRRNIDSAIRLNGYPAEIRQVLINIIMNSLHALTECPTKVVSLRGYTETGSSEKTCTEGDTCGTVESASLILEIANNGPAIPSNMLTTIFEPFVSTKELGTGIGLYVCRKIVMHHGGVIECESNPDWTTFRISIPLT